MIRRRQFGLGAAALALAPMINRGARADNAKNVLRVVPQANHRCSIPISRV